MRLPRKTACTRTRSLRVTALLSLTNRSGSGRTGRRPTSFCTSTRSARWTACRRAAAGLNVTFDAPTTLRYENLIYDPRYPALYDEDGRRVLETCLRRGPRLKDIHGRPPVQIELPEGAERIEASVFFCGVLKGHWGHFLTEGIARLWALLDGDVPGSTPLLFHDSRFLSVSWIEKFFHYAGIERDRFLEPKNFPSACAKSSSPIPRSR